MTAPFCRVQGVTRPSTDSLINFEVWLPATASAWNGRLKLKTDGTGGYAGATPVARMAADLAAGFVVAGRPTLNQIRNSLRQRALLGPVR